MSVTRYPNSARLGVKDTRLSRSIVVRNPSDTHHALCLLHCGCVLCRARTLGTVEQRGHGSLTMLMPHGSDSRLNFGQQTVQ